MQNYVLNFFCEHFCTSCCISPTNFKKSIISGKIVKIWKKASRKVCAPARVTSGMSLSKKHTLMNAFFNSQFNYCSLIWMCHSRENNNKINRLHERYLIIIYNDKRSSFDALLEKDGSVSIHERNIKILATGMFKFSRNLASPQMHECFKLKDHP